MSFILQNVGILWIGASQKAIPDLLELAEAPVRHLRARRSRAGTCSPIAVTIPLVILLTSFVARSRLGKAMRATAQDPEAARLMGINVDTTISLTFLLGGLMAGAAGLISALYQTSIWYFQGFSAGLLRVHGRRHGRHRQHPRRRARRGHHRRSSRASPTTASATTGRPAIVFVYLVIDHGLPAAGPARRGDQGGRMSRVAAAAARPARRHRHRACSCVDRGRALPALPAAARRPHQRRASSPSPTW